MIINPITGSEIEKVKLAYVVVLIDFITVLVILVFIWWLESS